VLSKDLSLGLRRLGREGITPVGPTSKVLQGLRLVFLGLGTEGGLFRSTLFTFDSEGSNCIIELEVFNEVLYQSSAMFE
jgi:hypothetical protein